MHPRWYSRFHWRLSKFGSHLVSDFYLQGVDARDETATPTPEKTKSTRKADDWLKQDSKSVTIREGVKKNRFFLGNSPKQRTPPTHRISLGLT